MTQRDNVCHVLRTEEQFRPGVYRHYKGGLYLAISLGWMNEVTEPHLRGVVYISMTTGEYHVRPYNSDKLDAWNDQVYVTRGENTGLWTPRFQYVGPQAVPPSEAKAPASDPGYPGS